MMSTYKDKPLGTIGHLGTYSFHETKNYTSGGEGGLLIINDTKLAHRAEVIREKGTNRSQFFRGQVDKYSWVDIGSSYLPSELQSAYLWGQLEKADEINRNRLNSWNAYFKGLKSLQEKGLVEFSVIPMGCTHNAHMFYIKLKDLKQRSDFIEHMEQSNISVAFHYIPLHSASAGKQFGEFSGSDCYTTKESERLVRLPMYFEISRNKIENINTAVMNFFLN